MYVNGSNLQFRVLDPVSGPLLTGHIDVHTDSPSGGSISPNARSKHSELLNIAANDGLGGNVDGHVHHYDSTNNAHYVDLFRLEPRRGKAGAYALVDGAVEGDLNRLYDVLQTDADGNAEGTTASEVYAYSDPATTTPLSPTDKFIVVVANGDLSPGAELQIGCRTWDAFEYENMMTAQLETATPTAPLDLDDTVNAAKYASVADHDTAGYTASGNLVFTLADIVGGNADPVINADGPVKHPCPTNSLFPTIRVNFTTREVLDGSIHGTRAQCVLGLHDYKDPVDFWDDQVMCWAPDHIYGESVDCTTLGIAAPTAGYIKDPVDNLHVTESLAGTGYRWRNGALTIQLLPVNADGTAAYELQPKTTLPVNKGKRVGGTHARAYNESGGTISNYVKDADDLALTDIHESGMLYESSIYWHFGEFAQEVQKSASSSVNCYGHSNWGSSYTQESRGITFGQYKALWDGITPTVLAQYDAAVLALEAALAGGDETVIAAAAVALKTLLNSDADLKKYHRFRDYGPGNIARHKLRDIDKDGGGGDGGNSTIDGLPAFVTDLEGLDTDTVGSNFKPGRRTWLDLLH